MATTTKRNIIEINGRRYDAVTGQVMGVSIIEHNIKASVPKPKAIRSIDGFSKKPESVGRPNSQSAPKPVRPLAVTEDKVVVATKVAATPSKSHSQVNQQRTRRHQQASTTLARRAVQRPIPGFKKQIKVQSLLKPTAATIVPKVSVNHIDQRHIVRAQATPRSSQISRFGKTAISAVHPTLTPIKVQVAPASTTTGFNINHPLEIFEQAIDSATNFVDTAAAKIHFKKKFRQHALSLAAGTLAIALIGGFMVYHNVPSAQLKIASFRAGVEATMPDFSAAGFAFDHVIKEQPGKVVIGFTASDNSNSYQLTQQTTNWDNQTMINSIASTYSSGQPNYTTIKAGPNTVYRFDNNDITWISDGTWYQISGTGPLSDSQVKSLVISS